MDERIEIIQAILDTQTDGTTVIFYRDLETVLKLLDELEELPPEAEPGVLPMRAQARRSAGTQGDTG